MQKFSKSERLCSRKSIDNLISCGNRLFCYPFRLVWLESETGSPFPVKLAISVPRKKFKKAVTRNRIKRLIRESYRLNKSLLYEKLNEKKREMDILLIYISDDEPDFNYINIRMQKLLLKLTDDDPVD